MSCNWGEAGSSCSRQLNFYICWGRCVFILVMTELVLFSYLTSDFLFYEFCKARWFGLLCGTGVVLQVLMIIVNYCVFSWVDIFKLLT